MKKILFIGLLIGFSVQLKAQDKEIEQFNKKVNADRLEKQKEVQSNSFTPYGKGAFSNVISNISLSSILNNGVDGKIELKSVANHWLSGGLTVEQKIGKNDKKATLYDFNKGLSNGTTVGLNFQFSLWKPKLSDEKFRNQVDLAKKKFAEANSIADYQTVTYRRLETEGPKEIKDMLPRIKVRNPIFVNFSMSFTKQRFSYATDSISLEKIDKSHITPDINLAVGFPFSPKRYLALVYTYSEGYEAADERNFTKPFGTTNNLVGQTLSFGNPIFEKDHKLTMEYRQTFAKEGDDKPVFAISPSVTYGIASDKAAFSLPLYFIKGTDKDSKPTGLQGGVVLSYVTELKSNWSKFSDGFGAQLILTAPLAMFDGLF